MSLLRFCSFESMSAIALSYFLIVEDMNTQQMYIFRQPHQGQYQKERKLEKNCYCFSLGVSKDNNSSARTICLEKIRINHQSVRLGSHDRDHDDRVPDFHDVRPLTPQSLPVVQGLKRLAFLAYFQSVNSPFLVGD